jgi:hypothetical protein
VSDNRRSGVGTTTVLLVVFVVLKLTGNVDWSWWWVLAPFWAPAFLAAFILLCVAVLGPKP